MKDMMFSVIKGIKKFIDLSVYLSAIESDSEWTVSGSVVIETTAIVANLDYLHHWKNKHYWMRDVYKKAMANLWMANYPTVPVASLYRRVAMLEKSCQQKFAEDGRLKKYKFI